MAYTTNRHILDWIDEMAALTRPKEIVWITGEEAQVEQLRQEGLVVTPPSRKGHYVFDIYRASLEQLFMARKALEGTAAYICARQNSAIDMPRLRSLAIKFQRSFEKREFTNFSELDQDFHNQIIQSCRNPYILKMYAAMERFISYYSIRSQEYMSSLGNDPGFSVLSS